MSDALTLPTQAEIVERFKARQDGDFFGDEVSVYLGFLEFEHAKAFLKPEVTAEEWDKVRAPLTRENVLAKMLDYMEFGWGKANDCRGLSANRTICHYIAWTWLAGDRDFSQKIVDEYRDNYRFYGKDILVMICTQYGWDHSKWDDGRRRNSESE